jgi:hypothetical protein
MLSVRRQLAAAEVFLEDLAEVEVPAAGAVVHLGVVQEATDKENKLQR